MTSFRNLQHVLACSMFILALPSTRAASPAPVSNAEDNAGAFHVSAFDFPESSLLSEQTRGYLKRRREEAQRTVSAKVPCPSILNVDAARAKEVEKCEADMVQSSARYKSMLSQYPALINPQKIAGVSAEVFTPTKGIAPGNEKRVLLNLHSGGFIAGWLTNSRLESIPIASVGRIKVISIDYREAPAYTFPAATQDAVAVYREILKSYKPMNIGIFGCSSGGLLTAETIAWLQKEHLPLPGGVSISCSGAAYWAEGDSGTLTRAIDGETGRMTGTSNLNPYFRNTYLNDPLAFPARSSAVMSKFPPTLIISATRDIALSSAVYTHSVLVDQGVDAQLLVWEGLGHAFFNDPDLPASREVYSSIVKFFDKHLDK